MAYLKCRHDALQNDIQLNDNQRHKGIIRDTVYMTLSINHCHFAERRTLFIVMLNVVMLSVIMLNVVMLSVTMLNVVMLSVVMLSVTMLNAIMPSVVAPFKTSFKSLKEK